MMVTEIDFVLKLGIPFINGYNKMKIEQNCLDNIRLKFHFNSDLLLSQSARNF